MKRRLCLWLPNWPVQRLKVARPELGRQPMVLVSRQRGRDIVVACCRSARKAYVHAGLPLAEAQALFSDSARDSHRPRFLPYDPQADLCGLRALAWDCETFSPLVGIEESASPSALLIDISGSDACFHGETNLVAQILRTMRDRGYHVRVGLADTIGAAWAMSHFGTRSRAWVIIPSGQSEQALRPLPIEALRLSTPVIQKLRTLGVGRISQLLTLPRQSLPSRFGAESLIRIEQALGRRHEPIVPERRPEPIREAWESESALHSKQAVHLVAASLLDRLIARLEQQANGILELRCEMGTEGKPAVEFCIRLLRPTVDCGHVMQLFRLHLEHITNLGAITRMDAEIVESAVLQVDEQRLWGVDDHDHDHEREFAALLEKLTSRLGREAVLRPILEAEQQPELAYRYQPCIESSRTVGGAEETKRSGHRFRLSRPLWLKREPVPVEVFSVVSDGPPYRLTWCNQAHRVARCWGPERITTGWWRGEHVRRDYYQVETVDGFRLWLFRDWAHGRWFLHAVFD